MSTTSLTDGTAASTLDEQFLDLVCHDRQLLAAEFEAIVGAEWDEPPGECSGRETAGPCADHGGARRMPPVRDPAPTLPRHPGRGGRSRQRSPPPHRTSVSLMTYEDKESTRSERQVIAHR